MTNIVVIGGGSYSWGPTFMRDIFDTPELRGSTILLQGIARNAWIWSMRLAKK